MMATGIPPHLSISNEISGLGDGIDRLRIEVKNELIEMRRELPELLKQAMLKNFEVNGAIPLTMQNLQSVMDDHCTRMEEKMESMLARAVPVASQDVAPSKDSRFDLFEWDNGELHMVSKEFEFPKSLPKDMWDLWHFGHLHNRIKPFRYLTTRDLNNNEGIQLSRIKRVMEFIEKVGLNWLASKPATDRFTMKTSVEDFTAVESSKFFELAWPIVGEHLKKSNSPRWTDALVGTVYNWLLKSHGSSQKKQNRKSKAESRQTESNEIELNENERVQSMVESNDNESNELASEQAESSAVEIEQSESTEVEIELFDSQSINSNNSNKVNAKKSKAKNKKANLSRPNKKRNRDARAKARSALKRVAISLNGAVVAVAVERNEENGRLD